MRRIALALALLAHAGPVLAQTAPAPKPAGPAITRISYWTTKPGKGEAARAFWKQFVPVFEEMKTKGLLVEYRFVTPSLHTGQDWDIAYVWVSRDMATYGAADAYFGEAVGKMDGARIEADFEAAFDGASHRDELWRGLAIP